MFSHQQTHKTLYIYIYSKPQYLVRTANTQATLNFHTIKGYTCAQKQRFWKEAQPSLTDSYRYHNY